MAQWAEVIVILIIGVAHAGIMWNKVSNLQKQQEDEKKARDAEKEEYEEEIRAMKEEYRKILDNHQKLEITIVNVPTKDDINKLTSEIHSLKLSVGKLETILSMMAYGRGIDPDKKFSET